MKQQKLRIGVIFGGRSCEHDVSIHSAASILANLDTNKYEVIPSGNHQRRYMAPWRDPG